MKLAILIVMILIVLTIEVFLLIDIKKYLAKALAMNYPTPVKARKKRKAH